MAAQAAKRINKVGFLVAMQEEAAPFIGALKLQKRAPHARAPIVVHEGSYKDATVLVYSPGVVDGKSLVGTDAAFLTAFLAAEDGLDLFVNAGTCGGFAARGGRVGDVYCCDEVKHHDRRVPIPGYDAMCVGHRRATPAPGLVNALSLKTGLCTTGNSLDCSPTDAPIIEASGAVCKDMEAAALAHAAELSGTPFLAIKVVTDIVDGPHATQDEFLANLSTASKALQKVLPEVLDYVTGKSVAEL